MGVKRLRRESWGNQGHGRGVRENKTSQSKGENVTMHGDGVGEGESLLDIEGQPETGCRQVKR